MTYPMMQKVRLGEQVPGGTCLGQAKVFTPKTHQSESGRLYIEKGIGISWDGQRESVPPSEMWEWQRDCGCRMG